ncbi:LysR family transcriptional regulator [Ancylobacter defluvii]|uniref:LysR family transcriptional regulator n=1 Tax=Ancylobacter defluvii TaxID=1282440 RepID=A0A9W6JVY7_9HYPH|nr:LysR family transcriptional regulator [Ancylobacter defluvii]MBS7589977.1 LysR family transcriptional regulator [Ancylobacter defluvii]GLK83105.1 LysR family transcriptional regulator [Ancylobacter defluvii]
MDTRHLEAFRAVYENGSMSAAAAVLRKSQPAISNLIARLEDEIGLKLFHRAHGRLEATPEAETLFAAIVRTLDAMDRTLAISRNLKGLSSATLLIASPPGLATYLLPPIIAGVLRENAGATARFITRSSYAVRDLGTIGAFDVGFAELPIDIHVASLELFEVGCMCVMRADHPLARETVVGPAQLDSMPFVTLFPEHITHIAAAEAFFEAHAHWNVVAEVEFFGTACVLVQQLGAVTLVDPATARFFQAMGLVAVPFRPVLPYRFGMFRPSTRPPSRISVAFMDRFRRAIAPDLLAPR